jgi:hypothetical protein
MRKFEFVIPEGMIIPFAEKMLELELDNTIVNVNDQGNDICIEVSYNKDETKALDTLEAFYHTLHDEYYDNLENEEEDNNDQEEQDH